MRTERVALTAFLRDPRTIIARLMEADVVLQRRGEQSLRLSLEDRGQDRDAVTALVAHLLATASADETVRALLLRSLGEKLAWLDLLPRHAREEFLAEFLRAAEAGAELGTGASVGQLLREWEETAAIYADRELYEQTTRALPGSDRSVPEPPIATDR